MRGAPEEPAPSPDGFEDWLAALRVAHPSASKSRTLARDVRVAALDAFGRFPDAVAHAELLGAYFRDSRLVDNGFYAPRGQRKFFEDLEDVVAHAERWRKWAGWKPRRSTKDELRRTNSDNGACGAGDAAPVMSAEEREEFFKELRK